MKTKYFLLQLVVMLFLTNTITAKTGDKPLVVGFQIEPPFVLKEGNHYEGVNIDLWEKIADSMNINYIFKEYTLDDLINGVVNGDVDIAISPLTVTASRIQQFNFSQPYYITNLAFATKYKDDNGILTFFSDLFSIGFLKAFISLFIVILIFGLFVWLMEKKKNSSQFRSGVRGIGDGIWWSAVTMSTVGYGDKAPVTRGGRILGFIWMFTAVIIISGLTASISSSLTVHKLKTQISSFNDLRKIHVGCIPGTGTAEFLTRYHIPFSNFTTVTNGLKGVDNDSIEAFVFDEAILNYYVGSTKYKEEIKIIPSAYFKEYFSFASTNDSLLKEINEALIEIIESNNWENDLEKYHIEYRD